MFRQITRLFFNDFNKKITRKSMEEIGRLETKLKEIIIEAIEHNNSKLISDLDIEKKLN